MAQNEPAWINAPVINLTTTDSTNNDAMRLIDADKAQAGTLILAAHQTEGRGQRGNSWSGKPDESLLMSLITQPATGIENQFAFSAAVAVAIAGVLKAVTNHAGVRIKWPNDLIFNDKKTGGILIENILLGRLWKYAVVGVGINLLQDGFDTVLPSATSLKMASGKVIDRMQLALLIRKAVMQAVSDMRATPEILEPYNELLFRREEVQEFIKDGRVWRAVVQGVLPDGQLEVRNAAGDIERYTHGNVIWKY